LSTYPAERCLPGVIPEQLPGAVRRAKAAAGELTAADTPVSYLRSTFLTGTRPAIACSMARRPGGRAGNDKAGIPYERIVAAAHVASGDPA
jgi:hypothetical protein